MDATFLSVWGLHSNLSMMWIETASKNGHVEINEQAWFTPRIIPLWPHTDECNRNSSCIKMADLSMNQPFNKDSLR